jgi:hypothetical protein
MVTLLGKKPQVARHRKCRRIALVDVSSAPNASTRTHFGVSDRSSDIWRAGQLDFAGCLAVQESAGWSSQARLRASDRLAGKPR